MNWSSFIKVWWTELIKVHELSSWTEFIKVHELISRTEFIKVHELSSRTEFIKVHELSSWTEFIKVHKLKMLHCCSVAVAVSLSQSSWQCRDVFVATSLSPLLCHSDVSVILSLSRGVFVTPSLSFCLHRDVYIANVTVILFLSWCSNIASQSPCHCHSVSVTIPPSSCHWYRVSDTLSLPPCLRHGRGGGCHVYHSHRVFTSRSLSPCLCHSLS